jgi:ankyrin repeat protein
MKPISDLCEAIERGDVERVASVLSSTPEAAQTIRWGENQQNQTDPLHYVSDCYFNDSLGNDSLGNDSLGNDSPGNDSPGNDTPGNKTHGNEARTTQTLLSFGAIQNGTSGRETPLIGARSLGAANVAKVLIVAGADIEATSIFGANALHWAAFMGMPDTVNLLLDHGAALETRCREFGSTPLFWAVQGFSRYGPRHKNDQTGAARMLLERGAIAHTLNIEGVSAKERAGEADSDAMRRLIKSYLV